MTLLLAGNASVSSVAFENEVGGVLSQGTSVTSLVPYCYGKFLFAVVSQAHRCTHSLYGFLVLLSQTVRSFTFSSDAAVNMVVDVQECRAAYILVGDVPPFELCLSLP